MKNFITIILLSGLVYTTQAQQKVHQNLHKSVHDNGTTMQVNISGTTGKKSVYYNQSYNIKGWTQSQKDALLKRIADSLQIQDPPPPPQPPVPPTRPGVNAEAKNAHINSSINDDGAVMSLDFSGTSKNKTFSYSRTFNVKGMSKQQKAALIKHVTDSLGISEQVKISGQ
ncbi:hypothetical protein [Mucilaginibacter lacusdianchii]|uniref:hypothetical protein n=1 Tax=Mucilaginibacter lacusdianchii TaxID=2684211 RepID=UPI00131D3BA8|nr:hypothetical protein [Mucilaginibacter sp. JXJ CY 39]